MFNLFCCKRRNLKIPKTQNEIKLDLNQNNNKDSQSIEVNQSQSLSILSNNLNNSTKDNILQKQNKFNIVNHINENKFENMNKNNTENIKNVVYNIINVDNINNINNNKKFFGLKRNINNTKKENEINKIIDIIKLNKRLNAGQKKIHQKNSVINDIIKFKKFDSEKEKNKIEINNSKEEGNVIKK